MRTRTVGALSLSALMLGGTMSGCGMHGQGIASAGSVAHGDAEAEANTARSLVARHKTDGAIRHAEAAVALSPRVAVYRALLGQTYLAAGRFTSARQAFADAHQLDGSDMRFALSLALAQIASGDGAGARATLDANPAIPAADRGLAIALAGDPAGAIAVLLPAARQPGAGAKTRQNLALAFALGGHWAEARALAALDVAPDKLDARMTEWAGFAQPKGKSDQVASLLGVRAAADQGFPIALALNATITPTASTQIAAARAPDPLSTVLRMPIPSSSGPVAQARPVIQFVGHPVVQPLPAGTGAAPLIAASSQPLRVALDTKAPANVARPMAKGRFYIQLGAYDSVGVARDAWTRMKKQGVSFGDRSPSGSYAGRHGHYYRLAVGGYTWTDALRLCREYVLRGGHCFARPASGDTTAAWVRPNPVKLASR